MAQNRSYHQLSLEERDSIAVFRAQGLSLGDIARRVHRDRSTISRELRRNRSAVRDLYHSGAAHVRASVRKRNSGKRPRLKNGRLRAYVRRHLRRGWSPEQIAGKLRTKRSPKLSICVESIYRYIYDPMVRCRDNFVPYLVRGHKRRQLRGHRHTHREIHIPERISILQRPPIVAARRQFGHWESDTVIARQSHAALSVSVERVSRFTKIAKLPRRTAHHLRIALTKRLSHYPPHARRSITYDNGQENVEHMKVNSVLNTMSYFCEPFHSWEKATVENTIGIIRRTFPKKTNFDRVSAHDIKRLEHRLNNTPRKILNYRTPLEVFKRSVALPH